MISSASSLTKDLPESNKVVSLTSLRKKQEEWKKKVLHLVEKVIEEQVTQECLVDACQQLTQNDYEDIVTERAITKLCGYPLCHKPLTNISTQKYRICLRSKKVYDITERKQFCSDWCYKASLFLKKQLHKEAPWLQGEDASPLKITFLQPLPLNQSGDQGKEVDIGLHRVSKKDADLELVPNHSSKPVSGPSSVAKQNISAPYITKDLLGKLCDQVKHLKIVEGKPHSAEQLEATPVTDLQNQSPLAQPAPNDTRISQLKNRNKCRDTYSKTRREKPGRQSSEGLLSKMKMVFLEWVTPKTFLFLFGEEEFSAMLERENLSVDQERTCSLEELQFQYMRLCKKLDLEEEQDAQYDRKVLGTAAESNSNENAKTKEHLGSKVNKKNKKRGTTATSSVEDDVLQEPVLPPMPSHSQLSMRKKLVIGKLHCIYKEILMPMGIPSEEVTHDLQGLVDTFMFSAHNVMFKAAEWTFIAIFILKMLSRRNTKILNALQQDKVQTFVGIVLGGLKTSVTELDQLLATVLDPHTVCQKKTLRNV